MAFKIISIRGHYEAYDANGNFICSGDTWKEVAEEVENYLVERR